MSSSTEHSVINDSPINTLRASIYHATLDYPSIEQIMNAHRMANAGKQAMGYTVPSTYLPRNKKRGAEESQDNKGLMPDGLIYTWSKSKRSGSIESAKYGKDGNQPPHSYLNINPWFKKKENSVKPPKIDRKTYIDDIVSYSKKYNYPSPDKYNVEPKKKVTEKKTVDPKTLIRSSFLDDYQYLSMNTPSPGDYNPQVLLIWLFQFKKERKTERSKSEVKKYVPGDWKPKNDQKQAPGDYEIIRLMTVVPNGENGKKIANSPVIERVKFGVIAKVCLHYNIASYNEEFFWKSTKKL